MANNRGCEKIFMYIFLFIFIGYKLFKWISELYYENMQVKGIVNFTIFIIGFIVFIRIVRYFSDSKPNN